jgi:hypothetical protein
MSLARLILLGGPKVGGRLKKKVLSLLMALYAILVVRG